MLNLSNLTDVERHSYVDYLKKICLREENCGPFQQRLLRDFMEDNDNREEKISFFNELCTYSFDPRNLEGNRETTCAICLGEFGRGDRVFCFPSCKHIFHSQCIYANMTRNKRCPFCRKNLPDALIHDISNNRVTVHMAPNNQPDDGPMKAIARMLGF